MGKRKRRPIVFTADEMRYKKIPIQIEPEVDKLIDKVVEIRLRKQLEEFSSESSDQDPPLGERQFIPINYSAPTGKEIVVLTLDEDLCQWLREHGYEENLLTLEETICTVLACYREKSLIQSRVDRTREQSIRSENHAEP